MQGDRAALHQSGIDFYTTGTSATVTLHCTAIPDALSDRVQQHYPSSVTEGRSQPSGAPLLITRLIRELLEHRATRNHVAVAPLLTATLNSKACRSAIKFGDALTPAACISLVHQLGQTTLPFQCAHGRPSVVPLLELGPASLHPSDHDDELVSTPNWRSKSIKSVESQK